VLTTDPPPAPVDGEKAVDFSDRVPAEPVTVKLRSSPELAGFPAPAWTGAPTPQTDRDLWLTAGLAEYAPIVAMEQAAEKGKTTPAEARRLDAALFRYRSTWLAAKAATPAWRQNGAGDASDEDKAKDRPRWVREETAAGVLALHRLRREAGAEEFDAAAAEFVKENDKKPVTGDSFVKALVMRTGRAELPDFIQLRNFAGRDPRAGVFTTQSFLDDPDRCLIVYGTEDDVAANKAAAIDLSVRLARKGVKPKVVADAAAEDADLADNHLILIGRPSTSKQAALYAVPVKFGTGRVTVRGEIYANMDTLVIAAGSNPKNPRYSVVVVAGLCGASTYLAGEVFSGTAPPAEVLVCPAAGRARPVVLSKVD